MLSDAFQRLAQQSASELQRMRDRFAAHVAGHDAVEFDEPGGLIVYSSQARPIFVARAVLLAKLNSDLGVFGWWWHGRATWTGSGPFDEIVLVGDREQVDEFHIDALTVTSESDAFALAELAGVLAGAQGVMYTRNGREISFWTLFDGTDLPSPGTPEESPSFPPPPTASLPPDAGRYSITEPPPRVGTRHSHPSPPRTSSPPQQRTSSPPPARGSVPPPRPSGGTLPPHSRRTNAEAHATREAYARIADLAMEAARLASPDGATQAIVTATIEAGAVAVNLVALASGRLMVIEAPDDLVAAVTAFANDGATHWRRLVARVADDDRGFSFDVELQ
jgi:hypothetical protein